MTSGPLLLAACVTTLLLAACGGQTTGPGPGGSSSGSSGSSSGASSSGGSGSSGASSSGSSSGTGFGCGMFTTTPSTVDPTLCQPQLQSATSCDGNVCSFEVAIPCLGDAGSLSGADAGTEQCTAWCNAAAPPGATPGFGFCQLQSVDGGTAIVARCGGCGV